MNSLFISYSRKQQDKAVELNDMKLRAFNWWRDDRIPGGVNWWNTICDAIEKSYCFIALITQDYIASEYCMTELRYAHTLGKPLIPLLLEPEVEDKYPSFLDEIQYERVFDWNPQQAVILILEAMRIVEANYNSQRDFSPRPESRPPMPKSYSEIPASDTIRDVIGYPFDWCMIPSGWYRIGQDPHTSFETHLRYQPVHSPGFAIAKYPITYSQFQAFIDARDGYFDQRWWAGLDLYTPDQRVKASEQSWKIDNHPRENVSWYDAMAFCRWLSFQLDGLFELEDKANWKVRLPLEAEWEIAARGSDERAYPYGNDFDVSKANTREAGHKATTPVTSYPGGASPFGVMDMIGNVWEWCLTRDNEQHTTTFVKTKISEHAYRVIRGGSYRNDSSESNSTFRDAIDPEHRQNWIGFRICCSLGFD
ncbi:MAG: hypothetical protein OHK0046_28450 [Anaerolineae bacterium]